MLHDLNFEIKAGERVGVVGRTGSGKSSLTLSLLRCIFTSGEVYYDGIPISSVNLDALRSHITIIPQMVRSSVYFITVRPYTYACILILIRCLLMLLNL